jgi:hypothetical protein
VPAILLHCNSSEPQRLSTVVAMPGSSRLPVSLRDTFNAHRGTPKGQLAVLNMEVYDPSRLFCT